VWQRLARADCVICVDALRERLGFSFQRIASRRRIMAGIRVPVRPHLRDLSSLPMSALLRASLDRHGLLMAAKVARMTVADLLKLPRFGPRQVLELLAVLESLPQTAQSGASDDSAVTTVPKDIDVAQMAQLEAGLQGRDIDSKDLRFGPLIADLGTRAQSLAKALKELRAGATRRDADDPWTSIPRTLAAINSELSRIDSMSLEDDLFDVLRALCKQERKARILAMRLGWDTGRSRTLQEVGDQVGLTRERIRQFESRSQRALAHRPVFSPSLARALALARNMGPCSEGEFGTQLQKTGIARAAWRPSTLVMAASYLGIPHGLRTLQHGETEFLAAEGSNLALADLVESVARDTARSEGAANTKDVAFALSESQERWVSQREVTLLIRATPGVRWLDEQRGWFWFGEHPQHRVLNNIRKMLSVAPRLLIDDLYEGLLRSYRMDSQPVCPKPIVLALCREVPWIKVRQISHLMAAIPLDWKEELTGVERTIVEVLMEAGGILDHHSWRMRCKERGVPLGSFGVYEGNSPVIHRVRPSIWGLRGIDPDPTLLVDLCEKVRARQMALAQAASQRGVEQFPPGSLIGKNRYVRLFDITASTFRHYAMTIAPSASMTPGSKFQVTLDSLALGEVELQADRRLRGLLPLLRKAGAQIGQRYLATVDLLRREVAMRRLDSTTVNVQPHDESAQEG
jgi:hypothetical protein